MTQLEFSGEWPLRLGLAIGFLLAAIAFVLYWRETRSRRDALRWILPLLRSFGVFLLVLMFSGPLLRHRKIVGHLGKIIVCIDASQSMSLPDPNLEPHRKFLALRSRGQIARNAAPNFELATAADNLASAAAIAGRARPEMRKNQLQEIAAQMLAALEKAMAVLKTTMGNGMPETRKTQKQRLDETVQHARLLASAPQESTKWAADLNALALDLLRQESIMREDYANASDSAISNLDSNSQAAFQKFSEKTRWSRAEAILFDPLTGLLRSLASQHRVELRSLNGSRASGGWRSENPARKETVFPDSFDSAPTNARTDLATVLKMLVAEKRGNERIAVVLLSDGQHNDGPSPLESARSLGNSGVPIYCVGFGATVRPPDAALIGVRAPESVFDEDHVKGELIIKDELPAGQVFTVRIEADGSNVWSKTLASEAQARREIPYDFRLSNPNGESNSQLADLQIHHVMLNLRAIIDASENEACTTNNDLAFAIQVVKQKSKVLLVNNRPSWEFRSLRDLLDQEGRWEVNDLLSGISDQGSVRRGTGRGEFPPDRETLFWSAAIIFGEVPEGIFSDQEIGWFNEFVEKRGGAVIFIDGQQHKRSEFENGPLSALLPVRWEDPPFVTGSFGLHAADIDRPAVVFSSESRTNALIWGRLAGPHGSAHVIPRPGSETLLELTGGEKPMAAVVARRQGSGRVVYLSFDETWRWRYGVGDLYYAKFWNQLIGWSMDPPFAVENQNTSLDAGNAMYRPGSKVLLRARLRDDFAHPLDHAKVDADLFRDQVLAATIHLKRDDHHSGVYTSQTSDLEEGNYEVRLKTDAFPTVEQNLVASFAVRLEESLELVDLTCNEALLREMAALSGGAYLREEEAGRLTRLLQPISQGRVVESETILWQSWWWFGTIIFLFGLEWILRKRGGLL